MFDKKFYFQYSKYIETYGYLIFMGTVITLTIAGCFLGNYFLNNTILGALIGLTLGIIISYEKYLKARIKAEEMRMMLEIHTSLTKNKN